MQVNEGQSGLGISAGPDPAAHRDHGADRNLPLQNRRDVDAFAGRHSRLIIRRVSFYDVKIGLISLGCPKNLVDSEVMLGLAQNGGPRSDERPVGRRRPRREHLRLHRLGQAGVDRHDPRDGAAQERRRVPPSDRDRMPGGALPRRAEGADPRDRRGAGHRRSARDRRRDWRVAVGQGRFGEPVVPADDALTASGQPAPSTASTWHQHPALSTRAPSTLPTYIYDADTPRLLATPKHYAYVKIAEGCDYKCAFCIIPTLRGKYRSRPSDSIVTEARALAARGVKELLLISQDTTFYGIDRHERGALARLLARAEHDRRPRVDPAALPLSDDHRRCDACRDGRLRQGLQVHRPAVAACVERRAQTDEAARHAAVVRHAARPHPCPGPRRRAPDHLHRRLSRRNRARTSTSSARSSRTTGSTMSASSRIPMKRARRPSGSTTTCRPSSRRPGDPA